MKTKKTNVVGYFVGLCLIFADSANAFEIDVDPQQLLDHFRILTISSLAVGEVGLVSASANFCRDGNKLKMNSGTKLQDSPSEYSVSFEVTRLPNNKLSIDYSKKGRRPNREFIGINLLDFSRPTDCDWLPRSYAVNFWDVDTFLGASSISEIIEKDVSNTDESLGDQISDLEDQSENPGSDESINEWSISESNSPIDDSPTVVLRKIADNDQYRTLGGKRTLVLRCREDKTRAYVTTNEYLTDESKRVLVRFDKEQAKYMVMLLSTDNDALFFPSPIATIKQLLQSNSLTLRYEPYMEAPETVTFSLEGLTDVIEPLTKACHWNL